MQFAVGQLVQALDEDLEGEVLSSEDGMVTLETRDGFVVRFRESELIPLKKMDKSSLDVSSQVIEAKEETKKKHSSRIKPKDRNKPPMEVDLHIHQLTKARGLSNFEMLNIQMDAAKRQLEFAIVKRIPKVVFIHGVGKGVLRSELEFLFRKYEQVTYYDADYQKYGVGALEVYIYQNVKSN